MIHENKLLYQVALKHGEYHVFHLSDGIKIEDGHLIYFSTLDLEHIL